MFKGARYFLKYCWKIQKSYIVFLTVMEAFQIVIILSGIIFPKYIINALFQDKRVDTTICYIAAFLGITLISNIIISFSKFYAEKGRDTMYRKFSILYARQVMNSDYERLEEPHFLDLREKALLCMSSNYGFAGTVLLTVNLAGKLFLIIGTVMIVSSLNILLLLLFLALILLNTLISSKMQKKNVKLDLTLVPLQRKLDYLHSLGNDFNYAKEIRLDHLCSHVLKLYKDQFCSLQKLYIEKNMNLYTGAAAGGVIRFLQQGIAYAYLIYKVFVSTLSMGSFTMYLNAILSFQSSVTEAFNIINTINQSTIYLQPFKEFMEMAGQRKKQGLVSMENFDDNSYSIQFIDVSFCYPNQKTYVLEHINFEIKSGEKISIVGENGAGKTTLIKLLTRLYEPTQGKILLNGIDIFEYSYEEYMGHFSVIFQDFKLFALSMKENIALTKSGTVTEEELKNVTERLGLYEKISSLEKKFETPVYKIFDSGGIELSGGEAQKLAIARAFMKNGNVIVLDEPTAALDPRAEYGIYQNFAALAQGKTAIYISHRLASCTLCDRIFVLREKSMVESGSHEELMQVKGYYYDLFQIQAGFYLDKEGGSIA